MGERNTYVLLDDLKSVKETQGSSSTEPASVYVIAQGYQVNAQGQFLVNGVPVVVDSLRRYDANTALTDMQRALRGDGSGAVAAATPDWQPVPTVGIKARVLANEGQSMEGGRSTVPMPLWMLRSPIAKRETHPAYGEQVNMTPDYGSYARAVMRPMSGELINDLAKWLDVATIPPERWEARNRIRAEPKRGRTFNALSTAFRKGRLGNRESFNWTPTDATRTGIVSFFSRGGKSVAQCLRPLQTIVRDAFVGGETTKYYKMIDILDLSPVQRRKVAALEKTDPIAMAFFHPSRHLYPREKKRATIDETRRGVAIDVRGRVKKVGAAAEAAEKEKREKKEAHRRKLVGAAEGKLSTIVGGVGVTDGAEETEMDLSTASFKGESTKSWCKLRVLTRTELGEELRDKPGTVLALIMIENAYKLRAKFGHTLFLVQTLIKGQYAHNGGPITMDSPLVREAMRLIIVKYGAMVRMDETQLVAQCAKVGKNFLAFPSDVAAAKGVAKHLVAVRDRFHALAAGPSRPTDRTIPTPAMALKFIDDACRGDSYIRHMDDIQRETAVAALTQPLVCITGQGGTGKTLTARAVVTALGATHVLALAFTASAAKNLSDKAKCPGATIHSAAYGSSIEAIMGNARNVRAVIIDEMSMVPPDLLHALLKRLAQDKAPVSLVLVMGDPKQIDSIQPGAVLDNLIKATIVSHCALSRVYRTGSASIKRVVAMVRGRQWEGLPAVVREEAEKAARDGKAPTVILRTVTSSTGEFRATDADMVREVENAIATDLRGYYHPTETLVTAYTRKFADLLNRLLVTVHLRPTAAQKGLMVPGTWLPGMYARVTKNTASMDVINGDRGIVVATGNVDSRSGRFIPASARATGLAITPPHSTMRGCVPAVVVRRDSAHTASAGRDFRITWTKGTSPGLLALGYASTAHTVQGREGKTAIAVVSFGCPEGVLNTLVSRATDRLIIVAMPNALTARGIRLRVERHTILGLAIHDAVERSKEAKAASRAAGAGRRSEASRRSHKKSKRRPSSASGSRAGAGAGAGAGAAAGAGDGGERERPRARKRQRSATEVAILAAHSASVAMVDGVRKAGSLSAYLLGMSS